MTLDSNYKVAVLFAPNEEILLNAIEGFKADLDDEEKDSKSTERPFKYEIARVYPAVRIEYTKVYPDPDEEATNKRSRRKRAGLE